MEGELGGALKENQGWANTSDTAKILRRPLDEDEDKAESRL